MSAGAGASSHLGRQPEWAVSPPPEAASLPARWDQLFGSAAEHAPPARTAALWAGREAALAELQGHPALVERICETYARFRAAQDRTVRGARHQQVSALAEAREHFFEACVLAQPIVARHLPHAWVWDSVRFIVIQVSEKPSVKRASRVVQGPPDAGQEPAT